MNRNDVYIKKKKKKKRDEFHFSEIHHSMNEMCPVQS